MHKYKQLIILLILVFIAFGVYSYKLDSVPNGIYVDEAVTAVNANSIILTGKDEYGKSYPTLFRFFGSYSPPLYVYLTTIPIFILGMNEFSVRIISVILGSIMVLIVYQYLKNAEFVNRDVRLFLLLIFIITPWNFFYARTGYELYLGFFLYSLGLLFLWSGIKSKLKLILGLMILSLSVYGAHAQMYSVPLVILLFLTIFFKEISKKYFIWGFIMAILIQLPRIVLFNTKAFLNKGDLFYITEIINNAEKIPVPLVISVPLSFLYSFLSKIVYYFSPEALFLLSDPDPQRSIPEISVFYSWMVIPYLIGLVIVLVNLKNKFMRFLLMMIIAAVIPPSFTRDPFTTQRALPLLLPLFLIISIGLSFIFERTKRRIFLAVFIVLFGLSVITFWRSYFVLLPAERAVTWNYGYKDLAKIIKENGSKKFIVEQGLGKPGYIELAFFLKTNPIILQKAVNQDIKNDYYNLTHFDQYINFDNIEIRTIVWEKDVYKTQILVADEIGISKEQAKEHFLDELFRISDPRGYPIFIGYQTNPEKKCEATKDFSPFCAQIKNN